MASPRLPGPLLRDAMGDRYERLRAERIARALIARAEDRAYLDSDPETDALLDRVRAGYSVNGVRIA